MNYILNRLCNVLPSCLKRIAMFFKKCVACFCLVSFCQAVFVQPGYSFSVGDEREVGNELLYKIRKAVKLVDEPDIQQYFKGLGKEVLAVAESHYFNYRFFIINDKEFNAFAAPSGLIFFNTGLIEATETEDELVSVLAHEIGHAVSRHIASRIEKGTTVNIATIGMVLAALALGGGEASQALFVGSFAANKSFQLHFSRQNEEEADRLAYEWMKKMDRNPEEMKEMLRTMRRITRYRMGKTVPQYLLTHPNPEVRLNYIQTLLQNDKDILKKKSKTDQFRFLRMKYRVMSMVKDSEKFRNYLNLKISDLNTSKFDVVMAKYGLSQLDRIENNHDSSLKLLDEVIGYFPGYPILLADKGIAVYESGQIDKAIEILEEARSKNINDMYSTFQLGKLYSVKEQYDKAELYLSLVANDLVEYPQVYFELGKIKSRQSRYGDSQYYLGKYYMYSGRMDLAKSNFEKAESTSDTSEKLKKNAKEMLKLIKEIK